jgi:hypothetical protein
MSAATVPSPLSAAKSWARSTPIALIALVFVVLFAASFVLGRATVSTTRRSPSIVPPAVQQPAAGADAAAEYCHVGRPC